MSAEYRTEVEQAADGWRTEVDRIIEIQNGPTLSQAEAIGIVNGAAGDNHVVVNAAGSMPGDLHRLWRPSDPKAYDLEYGNSCMGYEVGGAVGAKMADPSRDVYCFIGDGTFLLSSQEIMTAVQEGLKITVLLVDNYGYGSIAALSETRGSQGFACRFNYRGDDGQFSDDRVGIDLPANAASYGADVLTATTAEELQKALAEAAGIDNTVVIYVKVDAKGRFGGSGAWWDVPVPEDLRAGQHPAGPHRVRGRGREPEAVPVTAATAEAGRRDASAGRRGGRPGADPADHRRTAPRRLRRRHLRRARPGDRRRAGGGGQRHASRTRSPVSTPPLEPRGVGGDRAAEAVGDPAPDLRADGRAGRRSRPADQRGERQGAARRPR